jgi:N-acetylmuramoyl-L-alanine amidase
LSTVEGLGPDRGLRQAPFYLLREAEVPSVLVEAGYASHPEQARFLASSAARARIAAALAQGILAFLGI